MAILTTVFKRLNIPIAAHKTVGPETTLEYLGLILDTLLFETRLPQEKVDRMKAMINRVGSHDRVTKRKLLQLLGHFVNATKVILPGRAFMSFLFRLSTTVTPLHHHLRLSREARLDLGMWSSFLQNWNTRSLFLELATISNADLELFTDASGSIGHGAIFQDRWFSGTWDVDFLGLAQNTRESALIELFPIVAAAFIWGSLWQRKRIVFYCDNEPLVYILNKGRSQCPLIMRFIRRLTLISMEHSFYVTAQHIPGIHNSISDALSRQQIHKFRQLAPYARQIPETIPPLSSLLYP
ncbi:unnamed protein product [Didymodactylos carnosus]|uniref:Reverse transcriptase RNase H-like domain-containing protein n=1 Tax=Didymodactylos carnosus TaxID=1234261 RepID=A0A8S2Y5P9_9BILA|nr:unnamed protein product [Didymodactylos carnosus]CAF4271588.1 unnamed protein product [Didymodactylos carnosus]CAF4526949.1 unnamed protein product [Didymodactylos carnosus]